MFTSSWEHKSLNRKAFERQKSREKSLQDHIKFPYRSTTWCTKQFSYRQQWTNVEAKAVLKKEWTKLQKLPARDESQATSETEWYAKQTWKARKFILQHYRTCVISRTLNWRKNSESNKGREVLRGDIVKDDSRNHAVFTEQGASASHMTAAKGLDVNSRLHGCSGQAGDAVSAYTQVKNERRTRTSSSFGRELSKDLDQSAESKTTTTLGDSIDDPVVPLERNLYGHPLGLDS